MTDRKPLIPDLPDEREYPAALTARCELLECFTAKAGSRTLLARDKASGELYVVKCYLKDSPLYERAEPRAVQLLDAPPLPRFVAEYSGEEMRCVLREYVPGEPLSRVAAACKFSEEEIIGLGQKLCDQLASLHGLNPPVIHRDVKPQNVVLRPDGTPVLIDFGISRVVSKGRADTFIYGTDGFAPPEQYGFAPTDCRSDIYSLGMLLEWLRTGEAKPPEKPSTPLQKAIARCTAFDPRRRFSDIAQVKRALRAASPTARRRALLLRVAAALCLLALAGAGGWLLRERAGRAGPFAEPLIERAVRLNLGLDESRRLTKGMLDEVTGVYIVAGEAYPDADGFYAAVGRWYADGMPEGGTTASLEDLALLGNVEQVCVAAEQLMDISPVALCENLNKVEFKHNDIEDLSPLAGMAALTSVGVNDNPVRDLSPLVECPNLAFLDLCDVRTYDPSVIARLGNFDFLDLSNPTDSYNYLSGKRVLELHLNWTGLTSLEALDDITRLERLQIAHTAVTDLSPLEKHPGLREVNLAGIPAKDLSPLTGLPMLEVATVSEDMLPLVEALGEVPFEVRVE